MTAPTLTLELTETLAARIAKNWKATAQEDVRLVKAGGTWYVFGSEIALLRLANKCDKLAGRKVEYSDNLASWYISLDGLWA